MSNKQEDYKNVIMVEDDVNLLKLNTEILIRNGYNVYGAKTLAEAKQYIDTINNIDIAVLDVVLPDGDGLLFASEVKAAIGCPVLMLTSKNEHDDIVKGLSSDADMYMTKPFLIPELIARIEGLLKKHKKENKLKEYIIILGGGELQLDTVTRNAVLHEKNLSLSPKDFTLLLILAKNEGEIISQEVLYQSVWGQNLSDDTMALRSGIARLRKKLQGSAFEINAHRREGYVFEKI